MGREARCVSLKDVRPHDNRGGARGGFLLALGFRGGVHGGTQGGGMRLEVARAGEVREQESERTALKAFHQDRSRGYGVWTY